MIEYIRKRNNDIVKFDTSRIYNAISKAYLANGIVDDGEIQIIVNDIVDQLMNIAQILAEDEFINVEKIQDLVEQTLMKFSRFDIAKSYIVYRQERTKIRLQEESEEIQKLNSKKFHVIKHDGKQKVFSVVKIKKLYERIAGEYLETCPFDDIWHELKKYLMDGIKTFEIINLMSKSAVNLISLQNTDWQYIAGRLTTVDLRKQAARNRKINIDKIYSAESYLDLFKNYVDKGYYYKDFWNYYSEKDILKAGKYLNKNTDMTYNYTSVLMMKKRYMLNPNKIIRELPQEMYMSVALFLAILEDKEERLETAIQIYENISTQKISLPTPTLMNARTNFHQLSSCFKLNLDDDLRSIYHNIENMAQISKFGGGIGAYLGNIRAKGSSIRGVKGASGGSIPWIKVINDTAVAVNQLGARAGAISITTDIWHKDILDFLDLQTETGDIRRKSFDIFPAVSIPDLFMKRLENNEDWTLFDPKEIEDITGKKIQDLFGDEFEKFYEELEKDDRIILKQKISSKELFKKFLKTVVETGMPYSFFRDTVDRGNPNSHAGKIYSSQLCTEIAQNTSPSTFLEEVDEDGNVCIKYKAGDTVVCNLASINIAKVFTDEEIAKVIPIAMRILDNVIDLNFYPVKESEITAKKYRSVGLGFLGLAEHLATNKMMYDSVFAREYVDKLFEKYSYHTLLASNILANKRGAYSLFEGSDWSKGKLFGKDEKRFEKHGVLKNEWKILIDSIKKYGVRFGYHLSPAPNTSTSLVVGTTAGLLPIYKKYFVETNSIAPSVNVAPKLNKENMRYYKEYTNMKMPDVIDMIAVVQKWIDQAISFEWMINPAETSPADLYSYYLKARKQGIKTIYYVRSMSLEVKECTSCSG
ncbi:ribonucleoside-diphosphate reductase subunit alpha [Candidatus Gracilibacteria bacterium]|nr:ribonucleoside-diphosphate reductase subunit alpha [Candidatus Gracilibacteria bacterium]